MLAIHSALTCSVPSDCREDDHTRTFLDTVILFLEVTGDVTTACECMNQLHIPPSVQTRILRCAPVPS